ncbi:MAG: right-handed parallel beta-helix repeat-containing protein [Planctomycetes bacterium]|nr:right-handed parallel beta-helix repeat-containing protein [Planctomycetota bacterium]
MGAAAGFALAGCLLLFGAPLAGEAGDADLHVAPGGSDADPGTREKPLRSLEAARDLLRQRRRSGQSTGGATVWIHGGLYLREATFELGEEDSGTEGLPVSYRAYPGEEARLAGGRVVPRAALRPVADAAVLARLPEGARGRTLEADLRAAGVADLGGAGLEGGLEVFCGGKRLQPARWPNEDWALARRGQPDSKLEKTFRFTSGGEGPRAWRDPAEVLLHGYWRTDYADMVVRLERIDREAREIVLAEGLGDGPAEGRRFYAFPVLEELDRPGEWYLDSARGLLYLLPPEGFGAGEVEGEVDDEGKVDVEVIVSTLTQPMVALRQARHVELRGLTLEATRGTAVLIEGGLGNRVAGCEVRNTGGDAVVLHGGLRNGVLGCHIHDIGSAAVALVGGDRAALAPAGLHAVDNHIHHFARLGRSYRPAVRLEGVGNRVAHNRIHDAPHAAVLYSGNDHVIELNEIHHVVLETSDAGVLYSGYDWTFRGNVVRHNFFHHIPHPPGGYTRVVYLDDAHCSTETHGNVFYRVHQAVWIGGGRDNVVENNVFIECEEPVSIDNRGLRWTFLNPDGSILETGMYQKLKAVRHDQPPWSTRYPRLARILEEDPRAPLGNTLERNVWYRSPWRDPEAACRATSPRHIDRPYMRIADNFVAEADPGFVDAASGDFELREDSVVYRKVPGFQPIPFGRIGPMRGGDGDRAEGRGGFSGTARRE